MQSNELTRQAATFFDGLAIWAGHAAPQLVLAILLLIAGGWFAGWAGRTIRKLCVRSGLVDETLLGVLSSVTHYGLLIIVLVAVMSQLGIQTTSILAALGAAGLAIGLALQGTLQNIAAGMMLLWLRPFRVGDFIDTGSATGTVKEIGLFASELHTWDGLYMFVPNSELWNKRVINFSRLPTRLVELKVGVSYRDDIALARQILLDLASSDERTLPDPAPQVFVASLGDSAVNLSLRLWVARTDYFPLLREFTERSKLALEAAGLSIPFPQHDVHHYGLEALAEVRSAKGASAGAS